MTNSILNLEIQWKTAGTASLPAHASYVKPGYGSSYA
jgi:hypothetical protein